MLRVSDALRRSARIDSVPVSIWDVLGLQCGFVATVKRDIPQQIKDELACDGIQLFEVQYEWYLGPLDE